jgi:hypothetical protein
MLGPEDLGCRTIDPALEKAGWKVQDYKLGKGDSFFLGQRGRRKVGVPFFVA